MPHLDLVSLRLLISVIENRNITRSARANNIAASAVSKRISDLELRIGARLLYRSSDGVSPTPAGEALYCHAKRMIRLLEALEAELSEYAKGARGHVRLWANTSAVTQFLPEDLALYTRHYPDVRIELRESTSWVIADQVRDGMADIGIFSDHIGEIGLETRLYHRDTLMLVTPTGHPLAAGGPVRLADTLDTDHVGLHEGSSLQARILEEAERLGKRVRIRVQVLGFDGVRRMVEAGLGVGVLPRGAVVPYLGSGSFEAVDLADPWANRALLVGFRDFTTLPVTARALIECLAPSDGQAS